MWTAIVLLTRERYLFFYLVYFTTCTCMYLYMCTSCINISLFHTFCIFSCRLSLVKMMVVELFYFLMALAKSSVLTKSLFQCTSSMEMWNMSKQITLWYVYVYVYIVPGWKGLQKLETGGKFCVTNYHQTMPRGTDIVLALVSCEDELKPLCLVICKFVPAGHLNSSLLDWKSAVHVGEQFMKMLKYDHCRLQNCIRWTSGVNGLPRAAQVSSWPFSIMQSWRRSWDFWYQAPSTVLVHTLKKLGLARGRGYVLLLLWYMIWIFLHVIWFGVYWVHWVGSDYIVLCSDNIFVVFSPGFQ